jgi:hypothetical protein
MALDGGAFASDIVCCAVVVKEASKNTSGGSAAGEMTNPLAPVRSTCLS